MSAIRFTQNGKQILRNGKHFADTKSEEAAAQCLAYLNIPSYLRREAERMSGSRATRRALMVAADNIDAGFHE